MTSIERKKQELFNEVSRRKMFNRFERMDNQVPRGYLLFSLLMIPVCVFSGVFIADYQYLFGLQQYEQSADYNYTIDGYKIMFVTPSENKDMKGNYGFTYTGRSDDIFINKELLLNHNFDQVKRTCEHELMHNLGIGSKYHNFINVFEKQVDSNVCKSLMDKIRYR